MQHALSDHPGEEPNRGAQADQDGKVYRQQLWRPQHAGSHQNLSDIMGDGSGHGNTDDSPIRVKTDEQEETKRRQPCQADQPDAEQHLTSGSGIAGEKKRVTEKCRDTDEHGAEPRLFPGCQHHGQTQNSTGEAI